MIDGIEVVEPLVVEVEVEVGVSGGAVVVVVLLVVVGAVVVGLVVVVPVDDVPVVVSVGSGSSAGRMPGLPAVTVRRLEFAAADAGVAGGQVIPLPSLHTLGTM